MRSFRLTSLGYAIGGATILACLAICLSLYPAQAANGINRQVNYQAKLLDAAGSPVADGAYSIKFSLYDAATGGTRLWTATGTTGVPTAISVSVANGLFTMPLGDTSAAGQWQNPLNDAVNWNSDNLYLGVTIGADAEMTPRKRLTAAPQAFNSEMLQGMYASGTSFGANSLFTVNQTSNTAATGTRSALEIRSMGTSNANDFLLRGINDAGTPVFTINRAGSVTSSGSIMPSSDLSVSLGSLASRWANGYFGNVSSTNATSTNLYVQNGTIAALTSGNATLSGGSINGMAIGATSPSIGIFSNVTSTNSTTTGALYAGSISTPSFNASGITWTYATGSYTTSTNLYAANGTVTTLGFSNGTSTSWFGFATASGTTINANTANLAALTSPNATISGGTINGTSIGATTPSTGNFTNVTSTNSTTTGFLYAANATIGTFNATNLTWNSATGTYTTSTNLFAGNLTYTNASGTNLRTATLAVTDSSTSTFNWGISTLGNMLVGTSTYGGGLNSLFSLTGDDLFVNGNIGSASSVYTNGAFIAGSGSTYYGSGVITSNSSALNFMSSSTDLGTGAGYTFDTLNNLLYDDLLRLRSFGTNIYTFSTWGQLEIKSPTSPTSTIRITNNPGNSSITQNEGPFTIGTTNGDLTLQAGGRDLITGVVTVRPIGDGNATLGTQAERYNAYLWNVTSTNATTSNMAVTGYMTLGGVARNTWPSGGGSGGLWVTSTSPTVIHQETTSNAVAIGATNTSTNAILEVHGNTFLANNLNVSGTVVMASTTLSNLNVVNTNTSTLAGNLSIAGSTALGDATSDLIFANGRFVTDILPSSDLSVSLGSLANRWANGYFGNVSSTNATSTNLYTTNLAFTNASGTTLRTANLAVTDSSTSTFNWGITTLGNLLVGTSTYGGGSHPAFSLTGDDLYVQGNIASASSVYTNGAFVAGNGSTIYASGTITNTTGNVTLSASGGYILPSSDLSVSLGSLASRWANGYFGNVSSTNATSTNLYAQNGTITALTSGNATLSGGSINGMAIGATTPSTGNFTNVTSTNSTTTGFLYAANATIGTFNATNLTWTYATGTYTTSTNLYANSFTFTNASGSAVTSTSIVSNVIDNRIINSQAFKTVGSLSLGFGSSSRDVFVSGKYAYITLNAANLVNIYDISLPTTPKFVSSIALTAPRDLHVDGRYMYVGYADPAEKVGIVDISNPSNPVLINSITVNSQVRSLMSRGGYLYAQDDLELNTIDVRDPMRARIVGTNSLFGAWRMAMQGRYIYITDMGIGALNIYDTIDPAKPTLVSSTVLPAAGGQVLVSGSYAYVAAAGGGDWYTYNISNPANPSLVSTFNQSSPSLFRNALAGRYLYYAYGSSIEVVDVQNPNNLRYLGSQVLVPDSPYAVFASGKYVYAVTNFNLKVIDMGGIESASLLAHAGEIGELQVSGNGRVNNGLTVGGWVEIGNGGLESMGALTVSATNTTSTILGNLTVGTSTRDVAMNSLFAMNGNSLLVGGNIGSASSVYTNGEFVVGPGSTKFGDGYLTKNNGDLSVSSSNYLLLNAQGALGIIMMNAQGSFYIDATDAISITSKEQAVALHAGGNIGLQSDTGFVEPTGLISLGMDAKRFEGYFNNTTSTKSFVNNLSWDNASGTNATTTNMVVTGFMTLGGVTRNTWPSGGGGGAGVWATSTSPTVIHPSETSYAVAIGSTNTSTNAILEVHGNTFLANNLNVSGTVIMATTTLNNLTIINTNTSTLSGNLAVNGNLALGDSSSDVITANGRFNGDLVPLSDLGGSLGYGGLRWSNGNFYYVSTTNVSSTNLSAANATLGTLNFTTASGTTLRTANLAVTDSSTSTFNWGISTLGNMLVGTSTYGGGLNSLFAVNGDDLFVQGNIGSASSVYTNGEFVAGTGSTHYGNGSINTTDRDLNLSSFASLRLDSGAGNYIWMNSNDIVMISSTRYIALKPADGQVLPATDANISLGSDTNRFNGYLYNVTSTNATTTFLKYGTASGTSMTAGSLVVTGSATSTFNKGITTMGNLLVGTSTYGGGLGPSFSLSGDDLVTNGSIGTAGNLNVGGYFQVTGGDQPYIRIGRNLDAQTLLLSPTSIKNEAGEINIGGSNGYILPAYTPQSLGNDTYRFNGYFGNVTSTNATTTNFYASGAARVSGNLAALSNALVGASSYPGGLNAAFSMTGDDLYVAGNIGSASSVYTNGEFVVGAGSTRIGDGYIEKNDGAMALTASAGMSLTSGGGADLGLTAANYLILNSTNNLLLNPSTGFVEPWADQGVSLGSPGFRFNAELYDVTLDNSLSAVVSNANPVAKFVNNGADSGDTTWGAYINKLLVGQDSAATGTADYVMNVVYDKTTRSGICLHELGAANTCPGIVGQSIEAQGIINSDSFDLAEKYSVSGSATSSDLLILDQTAESTVKQSEGQAYDSRIIGVASTKPGFLLGWNQGIAVALSGHVPLKVSPQNGVIHVGDPLTSSPYSGYAMKATKPGMIVGRALEDASVTSTIETFIGVQYYAGNLLATDGTIAKVTDDLVMAPKATATAGNPTHDSWGLTFRGSAWNGAQAVNSDFILGNSVVSATSSSLTVKNASSTTLFALDQSGSLSVTNDLLVGGKIYPSARGHLQTEKYIYLDDTSAPTTTYMATNADGWQANSSYDFAERYYSPDALETGDLVVISQRGRIHVQRSLDDKQMLMGIVSTKPGFVAGAAATSTYPIALVGRVPTKVSTLKGAIKSGDLLAPSTIPGVAVKAISAGPIVGQALEDFDGMDVGKIEVYVNPVWWGGDQEPVAPIIQIIQPTSTSAVVETPNQIRQGLAVIVAGASKVHVSYTSILTYPNVQATPRGQVVGGWYTDNYSDTGFDIFLNELQTHEVIFAWRVEPTLAGDQVYSSEGTYAEINPITGQWTMAPQEEPPTLPAITSTEPELIPAETPTSTETLILPPTEATSTESSPTSTEPSPIL